MTADRVTAHPAVSEHLPRPYHSAGKFDIFSRSVSFGNDNFQYDTVSTNFDLTGEFLPHRHVAESQHPNLINEKFSIALL